MRLSDNFSEIILPSIFVRRISDASISIDLEERLNKRKDSFWTDLQSWNILSFFTNIDASIFVTPKLADKISEIYFLFQ